MEIFRAEKIAVVEDQSNTTCRCGEKLAIVRVIVNSLSRRSRLHVQMPVRRTHLEGLGYPSRSDPLFLPQIAACVRF